MCSQSADLLRKQIQATLPAYAKLALSPVTSEMPRQTPCGTAQIDELLQGGVSLGAITELVGMECSGRTTMASSYVATITQAGGICAWVDAADALDPESAAASGIDLERLLWVRCKTALQHKSNIISEALPMTTKDGSRSRRIGDCSPHFQAKGRDKREATLAFMQVSPKPENKPPSSPRKIIGTPGIANRPVIGGSRGREEQINSDRLPPRRGNNLLFKPRCAEPQPRREVSLPLHNAFPSSAVQTSGPMFNKSWKALKDSLRVTDLLLQNGDFSAIVLDLASMPPEALCRISSATWFRFRAVCERTGSSLILLTQLSCAGSGAEIVVRLNPGMIKAENKVIKAIHYHAAIERSREHGITSSTARLRKSPQRAHQWKSEAAWITRA